MSKASLYIRLAIVLIILSIVGFGGYQVYSGMYGTPDDSPEGEYVIEVEEGNDLGGVASQMQEDEVINSSFWFTLQSKLNDVEPLQEGKYTLNLPDDPKGLLDQINLESKRIAEENSQYDRPIVEGVLIKEGKNIDQIIDILVAEGISSKQALQNYAQNPNNFDRTKYEFLPESLTCEYGNLSTCAKYYPEGYLYPDTYDFFADSTPEEVFNKMLGNFELKVWSKVKDQVQAENIDFHKVIILASVMEKESGRTKGVTEENKDELAQERKIMAGVFLNRNEIGMTWGSDVTLEYGHGYKLCQQTFAVPNCISIDDPLTKTKYNTYINKGYPIGPVTNPQYANIYAAMNPIESDYIYFVSDVTGKKYFSETEAEFNQSIIDITNINAQLQAEN